MDEEERSRQCHNILDEKMTQEDYECSREGKFVRVSGVENEEVVLHECSISHAVCGIDIVGMGCV